MGALLMLIMLPLFLLYPFSHLFHVGLLFPPLELVSHRRILLPLRVQGRYWHKGKYKGQCRQASLQSRGPELGELQ